MSELSLISAVVVAAGALRQVFVLSAIVRSGQFLRQRPDIRPPSPAGEALAAPLGLGAGGGAGARHNLPAG